LSAGFVSVVMPKNQNGAPLRTPAIGIGALYSTSNGAWPLNGQNEPIILHSDNATAAGTLEKVTAVYSNLA